MLSTSRKDIDFRRDVDSFLQAEVCKEEQKVVDQMSALSLPMETLQMMGCFLFCFVLFL